jgi:hypothetical protein
VALLKIPHPDDPPMPFNRFTGVEQGEIISLLIRTVNTLIKKVDELEEIVRNLGK